MWAILIGTREAPGLVQWLRFLPKEGALAGQKLLAALRGRWAGLVYLATGWALLNSFSTSGFTTEMLSEPQTVSGGFSIGLQPLRLGL
jgi:hypothetical protein